MQRRLSRTFSPTLRSRPYSGMAKRPAEPRQLHQAAVIMLVVALAWNKAIAGAELVENDLSLDQAVREALDHNSRIASLKNTRDAMREKPAQVTGLPNPMFTYRGMDSTSGGAFPNTSEKRFEIEQPLPGFGKKALRQDVAQKNAEVMGFEAEVMEREIAMAVKEVCFELQVVQKTAAITRDEMAVLSAVAKVTETRYTTGEAAQSDMIKAQTEITVLKQNLVEWEGQENALKAKLALLMNRKDGQLPPRIVAPVPDRAIPDKARCLARALQERAELKSAQARVQRSERERELATRESQPDYRVGLEYRALEHQDDMVMFMVGVDLPLWQGKNRAMIREATMMKAASESDRESSERQVAFEVQDARFKLETARRTLDLYRNELIPQAELRAKSSEAGYRSGKVDFMDWLESERFLLSAKILAVTAEGTLGTGWARLERAVGGAL